MSSSPALPQRPWTASVYEQMVLATGNNGKIREFRELLAPLAVTIKAQSELGIDSPAETGLTFVENALIKARHAAKKTGMPTLADDSGLVVSALDGAPGLYSSRYAGSDASDLDNIKRLLQEMKSTPMAQRHAFFYSVVVFLRHPTDPAPLIAEGRWQGIILEQPRGEAGFGYDPLFFLPEKNCTAAELDSAEKNSCSHRGRATARLLELLTGS